MTNVFARHPEPGGPGPEAQAAGDPGQPGETPGPAGPAGHEQVVFCQDAQSGLRAIIAIYSTALGPALGGTRFYPYPTEDAALADVLNLSRAMAYKNALAGLDLGGGKAVIIGDPGRGQVRGAAARLRPLRRSRSAAATSPPATSAPTARTWTSSPGSAGYVTGRTVAERRRGRLLRPHRVRRVPGHARRGRARLGRRQPGRAHGRRRGRRQGRPPPGRPPGRGRRAGGDLRRQRRRGRAGAAPAPRGPRWPTAGRAGRAAARHLRAVRAGRGAGRRHGRRARGADRLRRRQQPAGPPRRSRRCSPTAASSTRPTTWSTPAA